MTRRFGSIEQLKSGRFRAYYRGPDGHRVRAPRTFTTEVQAQTWLTAEEGDLIRGTWESRRGGQELLRDYATRWVVERDDLRPRTVDLYASLIDHHIVPILGRYALRDLTPTVVDGWYRKLGTTTGQTARAQSYRVLRAMLNHAIRTGELSSNPCQMKGGGVAKAAERVPPTIAQIEAVANKMPPRYRMLVLAAAYGGLRIGELAALTRDDVVIVDGVAALHITKARHRIDGEWHVGDPKSDAGHRIVALPASLTTELEDHLARFVGPDGGSLVFCTRSGRMVATSNMSATLHRAQEKAKVPPFRFHDTRHAAATLALQSGATVKDVMARIGHSSTRAALLYQHTSQDRDQAIAAALDKARAGEAPVLRVVS